MKKIFLAVVALAAMTACSNDEFVSVDRAPINFGEAFVDNATRAADLTYGGGTTQLTAFSVYGTVKGKGVDTPVNIFSGNEVTGTVGSNDDDADGVMTPNIWTCSKTEYWVPGAAYKFVAVKDHYGVSAPQTNNGMPTSIDYNTQVHPTAGRQMDLIYAATEVAEAAADQGPVNFTFEHLLSKVQFTVTSTATGSYSHSIKNITVNNFQSRTYTIGGDANKDGKDDGTWNSNTSTPSHPISFGNIEGVTAASKENIGTTDEINGKTNETQMLLIPTTQAFDVTFTVEVWRKNGENNKTLVSTETKTVTVTDKPLVKGNAYNFTIHCELNKPIQFSVTDNPTGWGNGGELNVQ